MADTKFIWFDLGYTLIYMERELPYMNLLNSLGNSLRYEDVELGFHLTDKYFMREIEGFFNRGPEAYMDDYLKKLNEFLNIKNRISYSLMKEIYQGNNYSVTWKAYDFTIDTLKRLKSENIGIGLISNWNLTGRLVLQELQLTKLFDEIIISSEVNLNKPNKMIFELALETIGLGSNECIYVGDNYYDDIIGCEQVGIQGKLINRFGNIGIEELDIKQYNNIVEVVKEIA